MKLCWELLKGTPAGVGLLLIGAFISGCGGSGASNGPEPGSGQTTAVQESFDLIRVGDRLTITFGDIRVSEPVMERLVRDDGTISLLFEVQVTAAGKKASELEREIHGLFVDRYFKRLTVTVRLDQRVIYVGGFVREPSRYDYVGEMTVLQAISLAGGFSPFAKETKVELTRNDGTLLIVDCKKARDNSDYDVPIYPGDQIYVPRRFW